MEPPRLLIQINFPSWKIFFYQLDNRYVIIALGIHYTLVMIKKTKEKTVMTKGFKYKDVLKNREYRKLLLGSIINRFGDSIDAIAFTWLVYQITKSASWAALPGYIFAGLCFFMMVTAASVISGCVSIQFVKTCDQNYLARAGAVLGAGGMAATPIGAFLVSLVSVHLSAAFLIALCGISMVVILVFVALSKLDFEILGKKELVDAA